MESTNKIIDNFLIAYIQNRLNSVKEIIDENIQVNYSKIGNHHGIKNVIEKLTFNQHYDVKTVTVTNEMSYNINNIRTIYLIAHHLLANEHKSELYPLYFGGKYVFKINQLTNKIVEISYSQEYQVENTLYIRDWNLAERLSDLSNVSKSFYVERIYTSILDELDENKKIENLTKLLCYALDSNNIELIDKLSLDKVKFVRPKTMSYGKFEANNKAEVKEFISNTKNYYSMDQYSIRINSITKNDDTIIVETSHLTPQRTGTKKLNVNTKYHSFFDEDITITFKKINENYLVDSFICKKIVDVHYNGFELLRLS